jgi:hypothetical protein
MEVPMADTAFHTPTDEAQRRDVAAATVELAAMKASHDRAYTYRLASALETLGADCDRKVRDRIADVQRILAEVGSIAAEANQP